MFGAPTSGSPAKLGQTNKQAVVQVSGEAVQQDREAVLSSMLVPMGQIKAPPLFSPLELTKAFFLAVILLTVLTLTYDVFIIGRRGTIRLVGKNMAHIIVLLTVMYLLIFFKGGILG
jgi:hypothetical protein